MTVALLAGTKKGLAVFRADDRRKEWAFGGLQLNGWMCTAATRDSAGRTYVGVTNYPFGSAIVVSDDLTNWKQLDAAPRYAPEDKGNPLHNHLIGGGDPLGEYKGDRRYVDQIWTLHAHGETVYAGVSEAGLFVTRDRGESWEPVRGLNDHPTRESWAPGAGGLCAHSVLVDAENPARLWVGISAAGVFRTDDGGGTWAAKNEGVPSQGEFCVHGLAHDPMRADVIYRQDHHGMYRSDDGGDSWQAIETGLPIAHLSDGTDCVFGFPVVYDPASDTAFAIPLEGDSFRYPPGGRLAAYRTRDRGAHWQVVKDGLPDDSYTSILRGAMAVDGLDPCGVYFGTTAGKVYASSDAGESWAAFGPTFPRIYSVAAFRV